MVKNSLMRKGLITALSLILIVSPFLTAFIVQINEGNSIVRLKSFNSYKEIRDFVRARIEEAERNERLYEIIGWPMGSPIYFDSSVKSSLGIPLMAETDIGAQEYSATNIQVLGVDEVDTVKTDGRYIYMISENEALIVEAYPPENMRVISRMRVDGWPIGLFVNENRLVIIKYGNPPVKENYTVPPYWYWNVILEIHALSNVENPILIRSFSVEGNYVSSRMIGDHVYIVSTQPAIRYLDEDFEVVLPKVIVNGVVSDMPPQKIHYSNETEVPASYTIITAVDLYGEGLEYRAILTGYAACMYVSLSNIYVTMPKWNGKESTEIHRISVDGLQIVYEASGEVPGRVLNQFSMDEHNGYFRVATTTGHIARFLSEATSSNHVYTLKAETLEITGRLEGLAPGEEIYSARFMGNRCYLVTFKKVDPLFIIDLSNPEEPRVLGKLKMPGYSDYLHPYDENHLIGIGKETVEAEEGDFAWYQGLKISLFDVSNITSPRELSKMVIGDRGTDSPVLRDHHALLFDKKRNLLAIPILEAKIFREKYSGDIPPYTHGEYVFQGTYIFEISLEEGIGLRGRITHLESQDDLTKSGYYFDSKYEVTRSLYIEDTLYTVSSGKIKANNLTDLSEMAETELG